MTARWDKRGVVFASRGDWSWNATHAQVPVVDVVDDRTWRVFYAARDANGKSRTSWVDVEAENPANVLHVHREPIFDLGKLGTFDDSGIMPSSVVRVDDATRYLYYVGWTTRGTVPYHNSVGLAVSRDAGRTWSRYAEGPLFGPTLEEPYFTGTSCVLRDGATWKCWYLSCVRWTVFEGKPEALYDLKYAESDDGVRWRRDARTAIALREDEGEAGLASASVVRERGRWRMWYARRKLAHYRTDPSSSYRIGYAESADGVRWTRKDDDAGIDVSLDGWDSQMIAYPHVVVGRDGRKFLFYNGNGFGRSGFGYAVLDER